MKFIFLTIAFILAAFTGFAQEKTENNKHLLKDITGDYRLKLPVLLADIQDLQVAVISLDSMGKKHPIWNENQRQMTKESESEFENGMLSCAQGKDITIDVKTIKKNGYCMRTGYGDAAMGKSYVLNYVGFVKVRRLVIIEFGVIWTNCHHGYEEKNLIRKCEEEQKQKRINVDAFINKMVKGISFSPINKTR